MDRFTGKSVIVAGASGGINLAIAHAFGAEGARVTILSRSAEKIEAAAAGLRDRGFEAKGHACDVRDYERLKAVFAEAAGLYGPIDILVSGAAGNFLAPAVKMTANAFKTVVDIDLLGTFNVFHASFAYLRKPGATLIAITAGQAVNPMPLQIHACAAKAGVNMVTKCLAMEWGPAGIRVNAISPGPIADTVGMAKLTANAEAAAALTARVPLRTYGAKQDVAEAALYLASDAARYVTGTILNVDGGYELGDASLDALNG